MDFFARQDRARRQSGELVGLFIFSVTVVVLVLATLLTLIIGGAMDQAAERNGAGVDFSPVTAHWWYAHGGMLAICGMAALAIVLAGTLFKLASLASGGAVVARSMGADLVDANTQDPLQQRLRNVVEEMAMASGVPMPAVYVMNAESGINAFAAGHTPADSVITVTRGALEKLDRAELQGVIGHEFSHVLNGDMRLNMRLLACVAGLFGIATIGRVLLRVRGRRAGGIAAAGFAMFLLGWIGVLLGRMIQAAISRQREFLADASAVQFTRDPSGLRNALVKIAAAAGGSRLDAHGTGDVAHMLFASGLDEIFATHPPIEARIRALDPSFSPGEIVRETPKLAGEGTIPKPDRLVPRRSSDSFAALSRLVASPKLEHLRFAGQLRDALPLGLLADAGDPQRAVECLWALVLSRDETARARELEVLAGVYPPDMVARVRQRRETLATLADGLRMPLLMRLFPALGRRPVNERQSMVGLFDRVVAADGTITLSEYAFARLARLHLFEQTAPTGPVPRLAASTLEPELAVVLAVLARASTMDAATAAAAFDRGLACVLAAPRARYEPPSDWVPAMDAALARLDQMRLSEKARLVDALATVVSHDGRVEVAEAELLRAICGIVHCPLPPLLFAEAGVTAIDAHAGER